MNELLTVAEVAHLFKVEARTVYRWIKTERLRAIKTPGGQHRVPAGEVRREWESRVINEPEAAA